MRRPDSPILDEIERTVREIEGCEQRLAELKVKLSNDTRAIGTVQSKEARIAIAMYAYWYIHYLRSLNRVTALFE